MDNFNAFVSKICRDGKRFTDSEKNQVKSIIQSINATRLESSEMSLDQGRKIAATSERIKYLDRMFALRRKEQILLDELKKFM